jgi:hypothetical protein
MPKYAKISNLWTFKLRQKQRATCSTSCQAIRAWTGHGKARPRVRSPLPACMCLVPPISAPTTLAVSPHTPSLSYKPEITGDRRREQAPPPTQPPELRPPWPAHPSHSQSTIAARLASLETHEAPQALRPSRTSPETPNYPRRTSSAHRGTWTG